MEGIIGKFLSIMGSSLKSIQHTYVQIVPLDALLIHL